MVNRRNATRRKRRYTMNLNKIHWISLIEESNPNVPKFVPITSSKPDPKVKIIRDYILEKTMMKQMVSESE